MKILITGATGFIGQRVTQRLSTDDRFSISALARDLSRAGGLKDIGVEVIGGDILDPASLKKALQDKEIILHCAALMSNFDDAGRKAFYDVNAGGTKNLLESLNPSLVRQFIYVSTAGVYGPTGEVAVSEDAPYGANLSDYEWSKKEGELAALRYARERELPVTIVRPSPVYGAGMSYGWPETIESIRRGKMLIPGRGRAVIRLLNIRDLVEAIYLMIANPEAIGRIYNIAGPDILAVGEVFDTIADLVGVNRPKKVPYLPVYAASILMNLVPYSLRTKRTRLFTPHRVSFFAENHVYSIERAERNLAFKPMVSVRAGFKEMIDWLERNDR